MIRHPLAIATAAGLFSLFSASAGLAAPPPPPPGPPQPQIHFGLQFGTPDYGNGPYFMHHHNDCLSDGEIYGALHDQGYSRLRLVSDEGDTLDFFARRGTRLYELTVDSCSGDIVDRHRVWHY